MGFVQNILCGKKVHFSYEITDLKTQHCKTFLALCLQLKGETNDAIFQCQTQM
jgi:hypothetical protein